MSKKKAKGVKSHLNAKSTAKLHKEISELLEQNIPDPEAPPSKNVWLGARRRRDGRGPRACF